jgi:polyphosphate kinase 2 (PPK2 family)
MRERTVEGLGTENEWTRAYREINAFERQLSNFGTILVKCWIHISHEEQQRRLEQRDISVLDQDRLLGDISRRDIYESAIDEMLLQTSTLTASRRVIEGGDRLSAPIKYSAS